MSDNLIIYDIEKFKTNRDLKRKKEYTKVLRDARWKDE